MSRVILVVSHLYTFEVQEHECDSAGHWAPCGVAYRALYIHRINAMVATATRRCNDNVAPPPFLLILAALTRWRFMEEARSHPVGSRIECMSGRCVSCRVVVTTTLSFVSPPLFFRRSANAAPFSLFLSFPTLFLIFFTGHPSNTDPFHQSPLK